MAGVSASGAPLRAALALHAAGDLDGAERGYLAVLAATPDDADALHLLGVVAHARGQLALAEARLDAALARRPGDVAMLCNRGALLRDLGRPADALLSLDEAVRLGPNHALSWDNRGAVLLGLGRAGEAVLAHERAAQLDPRSAKARFNLGNAHAAAGHGAEAARCYEAALALEPTHAGALNNLGSALLHEGRAPEAEAVLARLVQAHPMHLAGWVNRAAALLALRRAGEALRCCEQALALDAGCALAHAHAGTAHMALDQPAAALASFDRALALTPGEPATLRGRANAGYALGRFDEAAAGYAEVLRLAPAADLLLGDLFNAKASACDWAGQADLVAAIRAGIAAGRPVATPFVARGLPLSPEEQLACSRIYATRTSTGVRPALQWRAKAAGERLRIGYFSSNFREHATAYHIAGLFEAHDRSAFEVYAYAMEPASGDAMQQRLAAGADRWVDLGTLGDAEAAHLARSHGLDIAIDLNGHIRGGRPGIFAERAAPLQVVYLGDPGTSGNPCIDYLIGDRTVIPGDPGRYCSEQVVFMPHSYQVNDDRCSISARVEPRAEAGLPAEAFVYCCLNHARKITPEVFAVWMAMLGQVEGSVLWLFAGDAAAQRLRGAAEEAGIAAGRLVFAPSLPAAEHRARYRLADLFLDTFDYNGHATSSDALWAGLPVLTRLGQTFPARVSASLLRALGLPELVTETTADYRAAGIALAQRPGELAALRQRLAERRLSSPLFDTKLFARHLEAAYAAIAARAQAGLAPAHLHVTA